MHKPESAQGNDTHQILCFIVIQMDHQIPARRPNIVIVKKKNETGPADYCLSKSESKKMKEKKREKKLSKVNMTVIPIVIGALGLIPKDLIKVVEELEIGGQA